LVAEKGDALGKQAYLQWSPFKDDTDYFEPSQKAIMLNYRVDDLLALEANLKAADVKVLDQIAEYDYSKFLIYLGLKRK
jgi:hypothetical protein